MQQDHVLAELKEHQATTQNDRHVHCTIQYLDACNKLFEQGTRSRNFSQNGRRMGWCDEAIMNSVPIESNKQKTFLSWQSLDLMRLTYDGFKGFIQSFFERHQDEDHYIIPVRLNGRAV